MAHENFSYDWFRSFFPVSRETHQKLDRYVTMIEKWQKSINLISNSTVPEIWNRHIVDSYQLVALISSDAIIVDVGCGAGLPGIVLAIAGFPVHLVESDGRKVAFLREAIRELGLNVVIHHQRVETICLPEECTVTARAFASVSLLLALLESTLTPLHKVLLLKGRSFQKELGEAGQDYRFDWHMTPSITDPSGAIITLSNIQPRGVIS